MKDKLKCVMYCVQQFEWIKQVLPASRQTYKQYWWYTK